MTSIERCRTAALGGHVEACDACGVERISYNSCRHRGCPKCQSLARAQWLDARKAELLNTQYFHVVFTVPAEIAEIVFQNREVLYDLLFRTTAATLQTIAADPQHLGAEIGFFAVLHSWGQNLSFHPHLHCVVPGGGLSPDGSRWISCRKGFLLPVKVLSRLFRRLFLTELQKMLDSGRLQFVSGPQALADPRAFAQRLAPLRKAPWVVFAKPPFAGPGQVLDYVGRYTHRVATSNNRLLDIKEGKVSFLWKNYRAGNAVAPVTLQAHEFMRRFLTHIPPAGFKRIRYYGFLGSRHRKIKLARCRELLGTPATAPDSEAEPETRRDFRDHHERLTGRSLRTCPLCHTGQMTCVFVLQPMTVTTRIDSS